MLRFYAQSHRDRMLRCALVALTFAAGGAGGTITSAQADQFGPLRGGWQSYSNDRFGMSFEYPAEAFRPGEPAANGGGLSFASADARLEIFAFHNTESDAPASLKRRLVGSEGYTNVTYSPAGQSWLVLSGFRGGNIFYEKYFFRDGVVSAFGMEFPKAAKPRYAPMIERIENSFRAGHSD